ncbi:MAG: membrane dipeptidase [Lacrimispora sp.]
MQLFDLHCDTILQLKEKSRDFLSRDTQFSLNELRKFSRLCQTMAIFIPDTLRGQDALEYFDCHAAYLKKLLAVQHELAGQVFQAKDIEIHTSQGRCAVIFAVESGAALGGSLERVDHLAALGVKFMTLVWNGENELGSGNETEKGLTEFGKQVIRRMESRGIIADVSHLNDRGFSDICETAEMPFMATHSNLRSVAGHKRNLTESQFQEIIRRKGVVGINLHAPFVSDEGISDEEHLFRHIYRMLELGGEDVIACGSDFDGDITTQLDSPVKLGEFGNYLLQKGISQPVVDKIFFENAQKFCERNFERRQKK